VGTVTVAPPARGTQQVQRAEREAQTVQLRRDGLGYREIADRLGCSVSGAYAMVKRVLARLPAESVDQLRQIECARLDELTATLMPLARAGDVQAAGTLVRVSAQRSRLLGLDPTREELKRQPWQIIIDPRLVPPPTLVADSDELAAIES
jgi:DNA-binding CsgD family transcriptional regulator